MRHTTRHGAVNFIFTSFATARVDTCERNEAGEMEISLLYDASADIDVEEGNERESNGNVKKWKMKREKLLWT